MKRAIALTALLASQLLWTACSEDDNGVSSTTTAADNQDAAEIIVENVALDSGGILESVEYTIVDEVNGTGVLGTEMTDFNKGYGLDEAVFDSTTCTWTFELERSYEGPFAGHQWNGLRTVHLMDELEGCVVEPDGNGIVKGVDMTFDFTGNSWNRHGEYGKTGSDSWQIRELHDDIPGGIVNGTHNRTGAGQRIIADGEERSYEFELNMTAYDLRVLELRGRRIPVEGTIEIVYDATRNGTTIHREATITFGDDGGRVDIGGSRYDFDPVSGEIAD